MNFKYFIILIICLICSTQSNAQSFQVQQRQVLGINVLSNALIGGIGGLINKKEGEKVGLVFLKNFAFGMTGGLVKYTAKYYAYHLNNPKNFYYAPINRLQFFLGHSIVMNASLNKPLLNTYYVNLYGIDIQIAIKKKEEKRIQARLSLASVGYAVVWGINDHQLNVNKSLLFGQLYFTMNKSPKPIGTLWPAGIAGFNSFVIREFNGKPFYESIPHEVVHTYQFYDNFTLSNFYEPRVVPLLETRKLYSSLSKFIISDYETAFQLLLYGIQPKPAHYRNYYEFEAEHFSNRGYIRR